MLGERVGVRFSMLEVYEDNDAGEERIGLWVAQARGE